MPNSKLDGGEPGCELGRPKEAAEQCPKNGINIGSYPVVGSADPVRRDSSSSCAPRGKSDKEDGYAMTASGAQVFKCLNIVAAPDLSGDSGGLVSMGGGRGVAVAGNTGKACEIAALFVRRPPEEYTGAKRVESMLTVRLRQQENEEKKQRGSCLSLSRNIGGMPYDGGQSMVQIRVHLPPYDGKLSLAVISVPPAMRVADLLKDVINQNGCRLGKAASAVWEFRLYDEDLEEPDYDCPPIDGSTLLGCLGLSDIAFCCASSCMITPSSLTLASSSKEVGETPLDTADPLAALRDSPLACSAHSVRTLIRSCRAVIAHLTFRARSIAAQELRLQCNAHQPVLRYVTKRNSVQFRAAVSRGTNGRK